MLDSLDHLLENLFAYGIPALVILAGFLASLLCLFALFGLTQPGDKFQKLEAIGISVITICCCIWFFKWKGEMLPDQEGYSHVGPTVAFFITSVVWFIPIILRNCFIPFIVSGIVYVGIAIFGL